MMRIIVLASALAAAFLFAGQPAKADWLCGANRCV
jgi:hypothetical protein